MDDSGEDPEPNGVVSSSIPGCEFVSLIDGNLARWLSASCVPKKEQEKERK
jgi:hypothetical protein